MRIRYYGHFGKITGYGRAAHDYLSALDEYGDCELEIVPLSTRDGETQVVVEPRYSALDRLVVSSSDDTHAPDVAIYHTLPRVLAEMDWPEVPSTTKRVAMTTWETSDMPPEVRDGLRSYDEILVPSTFCKAQMTSVKGEPTLPVSVIPHCFDPDFWEMGWADWERDEKPRPFTFYTIGAWSERKNLEGILRAYLHEFSSNDDVRLVIISGNCDFNAVRSLIARTGLSQDRLPEIHIPDGRLDERQLLDLHRGGDCFVSATRGEGFGLGHFEAAIMGNIIVTPTWGGHWEFLHDYPTQAGRIEHFLTPCFGSEMRGEVVERNGQKMQMAKVVMPHGVDCQQTWAEPSLKDIATAMRNATRMVKTSQRNTPCQTARTRLEERYGYEVIGPQLVELLKEITT